MFPSVPILILSSGILSPEPEATVKNFKSPPLLLAVDYIIDPGPLNLSASANNFIPTVEPLPLGPCKFTNNPLAEAALSSILIVNLVLPPAVPFTNGYTSNSSVPIIVPVGAIMRLLLFLIYPLTSNLYPGVILSIPILPFARIVNAELTPVELDVLPIEKFDAPTPHEFNPYTQ